jgi:YHS domain-containing protein
MLRTTTLAFVVLATFGLLIASGCNNQPATTEKPATTGAHDHDAVDPAIEASLAKLPPELHDLAHDQRICPVSGEPLGSMGVPLPVEVQDKTVLICCDHCKETIEQNPEKYLAKLAESKAGSHDE